MCGSLMDDKFLVLFFLRIRTTHNSHTNVSPDKCTQVFKKKTERVWLIVPNDLKKLISKFDIILIN